MPAISTPRSVKRPRAATVEVIEHDNLGPGASASDLVSFLTSYNNEIHNDDGDEEEEDGAGDEATSNEEDVEDPDGDVMATPSKRSKQGLVGSAGGSTPRSTPTKTRKTPTPRKLKLNTTAQDTHFAGIIRPSKSDAYFHSMARSARTSGNPYSALVTPLSQAQYQSYASSARSKGKSKAVVSDLQDSLSGRFTQWQMELEQGFNLLIYGFGSKRRLLDRFVTERLSKYGHCVVVNGYYPQIGVRDVLSKIEATLSVPQDIPFPPSANSPLDRSVHRIYKYFLPSFALPDDIKRLQPTATAPLYLVVHNIDSSTIRTPRSLAVLSLLASSPNIHIIASFDHVHTPLLFSTTIATAPAHSYLPGSWTGTPPHSRGFNWVYHNATTFDDYDLEIASQRLSASSSSLGGITSNSTGGISEEGALQILRSVPPMALRLLKLLFTKQLAALPVQPSYHTAYPVAGTAPIFATDNDILQTLSREKFIAREEERYNALLGEFKDHGLVVEAGVDGEGRTGRWLWVPLAKSAIERLLQSMGEVET
ncbi:MAG: Origin recognition complex subunit 2 [Tremellales sp. Tagirdzhanova-0007]|nr:MAG: Origin recognition complex subunit 2 [Tremellales sp. Tagirdzhanova-0007]